MISRASVIPRTTIAQVSPLEEVADLVQYLSLKRSDHEVESLVRILKSPDTEDGVLASWLRQLKESIFLLNKDNESFNNRRLVFALLDLDWTHRGPAVCTVYHQLILNMVSAHTYYLPMVLRMILNIFTDGNLESNNVTENVSYRRAHMLLKDIISLVPKSPDTIRGLLEKQFPYWKRPGNVLFSYVANSLHLSSYMTSHRTLILECLIDKFILLDVHCPRATIELKELEKEESEQLGEMDIDDEVSSSSEMALPLANTLDALMDYMFTFITNTCLCRDDRQLDWEVAKKLYRELLTVFDKVIFPTCQSCHVPFVMFYVCSLRPALCDGFLDFLWKKVTHPNVAAVRKQTATYYIGSLLARGLYANVDTVVACFNLMCHWIHSYINNYDGQQGSDMGIHATFYSVCQSVFYVFAFRHKELINMTHGFKYLRSLNFERVVSCRLNPLKFCQPTIMQNFANVARNYQIAYCLPIIERNNRNLARSSNTAAGVSSLGVFFPFDPYLLKRSKKWIDPLYRVYDVQSEDESIERDEDDSPMDDGSTHANEELFSYGHSPGFRQQTTLLLLPER